MATPKESPYRALYVAAGEAHGVSPDLLERQGFAESSWNPEALGPMTKYGQARGLAQFIPGTGKAYGLLTDADFHDPQKAIPAQARYMADLKKRFGGSDELALAAYNMGPTALQRKLDKAGGIIENAEIPEETRGYLTKILEGKQSGWAPDGTRPLSRINFGTPSAPVESALDRISSATPEELGTDSERSSWEAFMGGLERSSIASDYKSHEVTGWGARPDWTPTPQDVEKVTAAGIGEAGATFVFNNAHSGDDLDGLIDIAKENRSSSSADSRGDSLRVLRVALARCSATLSLMELSSCREELALDVSSILEQHVSSLEDLELELRARLMGLSLNHLEKVLQELTPTTSLQSSLELLVGRRFMVSP